MIAIKCLVPLSGLVLVLNIAGLVVADTLSELDYLAEISNPLLDPRTYGPDHRSDNFFRDLQKVYDTFKRSSFSSDSMVTLAGVPGSYFDFGTYPTAFAQTTTGSTGLHLDRWDAKEGIGMRLYAMYHAHKQANISPADLVRANLLRQLGNAVEFPFTKLELLGQYDGMRRNQVIDIIKNEVIAAIERVVVGMDEEVRALINKKDETTSVSATVAIVGLYNIVTVSIGDGKILSVGAKNNNINVLTPPNSDPQNYFGAARNRKTPLKARVAFHKTSEHQFLLFQSPVVSSVLNDVQGLQAVVNANAQNRQESDVLKASVDAILAQAKSQVTVTDGPDSDLSVGLIYLNKRPNSIREFKQ